MNFGYDKDYHLYSQTITNSVSTALGVISLSLIWNGTKLIFDCNLVFYLGFVWDFFPNSLRCTKSIALVIVGNCNGTILKPFSRVKTFKKSVSIICHPGLIFWASVIWKQCWLMDVLEIPDARTLPTEQSVLLSQIQITTKIQLTQPWTTEFYTISMSQFVVFPRNGGWKCSFP